ncbi:hypothetical protein A3C09_00795 [Candidatus Uhrbacteria bacterium RIFCSPHIGHO2_02_FULL_47_44]|uniref:CDP-alcohol phosphatidyltransferase n=1 Tax=Candidatus Uhrbacteria bacterium RIFCSPLOWO2_02_FULL_48_18 TaxID=1802408 RepID=A0A1F7VBX8_9BACT|nr:MAG: hypothetical protein A2839_05200 [Candidatus Uhrbacteria bacterium RIFCSPHIGHO2_01_FULL_47_10]OGL71492.1 MAG: hypothetical protein A3C09_00795 [Candidatus Uhrbacteria bacterium RIFCSPHIGHO2_02_FULL_47_44]OGL77671.1 MAG: hypothetical protein A3E97_04020 [Candidatus Uhrbacteria bacterium RIFCSPHIGHO2_12_FULL_47_12]OGL82396.1 MAG: hypothetical protein A3B20_01425 [Candidatus Uhrbacteria bacterium RIFCSPLOWO2_01_FULL_47_17]OGL88042.1 MAG: hypothetical protein A3I41_02955 [Candidatus Uhrbact
MDQDDRKVADLLEDQDIVDRKFADRVAKRFDDIETTPNWLTVWRIILAVPTLLCFFIANLFVNKNQDFTLWLWGTLGTALLYMSHELWNFYHKKNDMLVTTSRLLFFSPFLTVSAFAIQSLHRDALIWLLCMTAGGLFYIWAALLDAFDGALARFQDDRDKIPKHARPRTSESDEYNLPFSKRLNLQGSSHYGGVLDPLSDKILYFVTVFPLGWNTVEHLYLLFSLFVALLLTLIRFRAIRRAFEIAGKGSANRFGKYKIWVEVATVAALALLLMGPFRVLCANILIGTALIIGILSLAGHAWLGYKKAVALRKAAAARRKSSSSLRIVK